MGKLIHTNPYISFILMGIEIEFLGKCNDTTLAEWNIPNRSNKDFGNAIKNIPSLQKYIPYLTSHQMYDSFRCGLAHALSPKSPITLSSKEEMKHLLEHNGRLNFRVEDFYEDFKNACTYIINKDYPTDDKMNKDFLNIPDSQ
jgi:hypothetical protein